IHRGAAVLCSREGHHVLHNPYRSTNFDSLELQRTAIQDLVCDHSLPPAWYPFMVDNKPAEMPTRCVEVSKTLMNLNISFDVVFISRHLCILIQVFFRGTEDYCRFRIPIAIRNCGEFFVYLLQPTQGCMGYCAKGEDQ
uniref:Uncharacterized protein n=1 Tax=Strigops habroptila TaxID=2489341 RepID=A0A672V7G4_STRHB